MADEGSSPEDYTSSSPDEFKEQIDSDTELTYKALHYPNWNVEVYWTRPDYQEMENPSFNAGGVAFAVKDGVNFTYTGILKVEFKKGEEVVLDRFNRPYQILVDPGKHCAINLGRLDLGEFDEGDYSVSCTALLRGNDGEYEGKTETWNVKIQMEISSDE